MALTNCPPCQGTGSAGGRTRTSPPIKCRLCDGTGEITEETAEAFWNSLRENQGRHQPWFSIGEVAGWR